MDEASLKNYKELNVKEGELKAILSQKNKNQESQFDIMLADKNIEISKVKLRIATLEHDVLNMFYHMLVTSMIQRSFLN